jgi:carboxyl-terminal processing protease
MTRYKHGEFFVADSIKFNDSLKFQTLNGRTVYGGGGIMPDYFVPLDTTQNSIYFNRLFSVNALREYAFKYSRANQKRLEDMGLEKYLNDFAVNDQMLNQLVELGNREGVKPMYQDLQRHKAVFQNYLKAEIARRIWGNEGFFPVINETNEVLQEAVKMFDRIPELNRHSL